MSLPDTAVTALVTLTLNAGTTAVAVIAGVQSQRLQPQVWLVLDSGSSDGTVQAFTQAGADVVPVDRALFDHAATRQMAVDRLDGADAVVFMTQDAALADADALGTLVACLEDPRIGVAYGRQVPRPGAGAIERHARLFNYPDAGAVHMMDDAARLGIKAAFCSNSFAAWRRSALLSVGGFPSPCILGEDMLTAARLLQAGYGVVYCADAHVVHSHALTAGGEARRYFDTGVMHVDNAWLLEAFGSAGGEGIRFVWSEVRYLATRGAVLRIPEALVRDVVKLAAYHLGRAYRLLPRDWCRRMSMNPGYWDHGRGDHATT
ncbi:MAG: rhamnosyltransferase [Coprothermobacter sp.]|nr:rhamnosyltransferase [Coprothermobacter sp.]